MLHRLAESSDNVTNSQKILKTVVVLRVAILDQVRCYFEHKIKTLRAVSHSVRKVVLMCMMQALKTVGVLRVASCGLHTH